MSTLQAAPILLLWLASFAMQAGAATVFAAGTDTVRACSFAVHPAADFWSVWHGWKSAFPKYIPAIVFGTAGLGSLCSATVHALP